MDTLTNETKIFSIRGKNVLGTELSPCCHSPKTGYFRDGFCRITEDDLGVHSVCVIVDEDFLEFSRSRGNDLSTPVPQFAFPGLKPGDKWCLCAARWAEAYRAGKAPRVVLEATHEKTLEIVPLAHLKNFAFQN